MKKEYWKKSVLEAYDCTRLSLKAPMILILAHQLYSVISCKRVSVSDVLITASRLGLVGLILLQTLIGIKSARVKALWTFIVIEIFNLTELAESIIQKNFDEPLFLMTITFYTICLQSSLVDSRLWFWGIIGKHYLQFCSFEYLLNKSILKNLSLVLALSLGVAYYNRTKKKNYFKLQTSYINLKKQYKKDNFQKLTFILIAFNRHLEFKSASEFTYSELACTEHNLIETLSSVLLKVDHQNTKSVIEAIKEQTQLSGDLDAELGVSKAGTKSYNWKLKSDQKRIYLLATEVTQALDCQARISSDNCKAKILNCVSHELRTPTNGITMLIEQLIESEFSEVREKCLEKLWMLRVSSKILNYIVSDIVDYCQFMSGSFALKKEEFPIKLTIQEVVKTIQIQAKQKGIRIRLRYDSLLPEVAYTDSMRLSQVLENLLKNSLKYTNIGTIELCAVLTELNQLKVSIRDTGVGINQAKAKLLQELLENNEVQGLHTCGIGLQVSNLIAQELGGTKIGFTSTEGKGSIFSFYVDIFKEVPETTPSSDNSGEFPVELNSSIKLKHLSVKINQPCSQEETLVVEDNDFNRVIITTLLASHGIKYLEAKDGVEAVKVVKTQDKKGSPIKVVLMDFNMPRMNGWDATRTIHRMHEEQTLSFLPFIVGYTAYNSQEDISLCYECGMVTHLIKPAKAEEILKVVHRYLQQVSR